MLANLPRSANPDLLVGFETSDDAGVFRLPDGRALVQTMDFFTPVVDDPYAYGQIAAANALSDVYAMGGIPITVMNIACFEPSMAPPEVWANVLRGMADKTVEAGAVVVGGHTVEDKEPKFGLSVTGLVDAERVFANTNARVGDQISLTKPLGTGIVTTAAKNDAASPEELAATIETMATLNAQAAQDGLAVGVRCATDITGFGLAGHLFNIARASGVRIRISVGALPVLPGVMRMIAEDHTTGGAGKTQRHLGDQLDIGGVDDAFVHLAVDPQTSGGLALFAPGQVADYPVIGEVIAGAPGIELQP